MGKFNQKVYKKNNTELFEFRVEKFEDINKKTNKKIIPLFINYPTAGQNY